VTDPARRPLARYAHPCPVCRRESLPGTVEGMYTREGLVRHLLETHGEIVPPEVKPTGEGHHHMTGDGYTCACGWRNPIALQHAKDCGRPVPTPEAPRAP
jgi:hypothetical protein